MPLQKQPVAINFANGLDTKTDSKQIPIGKFLALNNMVFTKTNKLTKRNGYPQLTLLPNSDQTTLTTLNDNLIATGSNLYAYSQDTDQWLNQGLVQPVQLDVQPLVRASTGQTSPDAAVADTGLTCLTYVDASVAYYQISDSSTGQQIVARTTLPATATNPRVFLLGRYFIITFMATVGGIPHLQYIAIPTAVPTSPHAAADISTDVKSLTTGYDAYSVNNNLYFGWSAGSNAIKLTYLSSTLVVAAAKTIASHTADVMSITADASASTAVIWISYWDASSTNAYTAAFSQLLNPILTSTLFATLNTMPSITSVANAGSVTIFYDEQTTYTYSPNDRTDIIERVSVTQAGVVSATVAIMRGTALASKAFIAENGTTYLMVAYGSPNQPTYFLLDNSGNIVLKLAYSNGGGFYPTQVLPSVATSGDTYLTPYLIKDFLAAVNKGTALPSGTPSNGIYTQTGINLAKFSINTSGQYSSEIANTLFLTGGQLWQYDGVRPVENGFHVYPEQLTAVGIGTGGTIGAGTYYYVFTYEWTDNQGNLQRSAPSIPFNAGTYTGTTNSTVINVPTLRLTAKHGPNPVRIVGYRWSSNQQVYYQFTSITAPVVNNRTVDSVTFIDTLSDAQILGNPILYTTGGVIENIGAPASIASALFKNRLFLVDAEDQNLLWYSKQVIENTPVEMSDLLTVYVAPTSGAQGSTGPVTALAAMDDKLIIFKRDAIYYLTGTGPDNTGSNNDFSDPVYITSSVGCDNPNSIVLMPNGIMFQSDKGIWILGRDLSTAYIGDGVEKYNGSTVYSAQAIPATNQVRFILANNVTLMYDYYQKQWGTHNNLEAISATLYQGAHTYLSSFGAVEKEVPNTYTDGIGQLVLVSLTTSWMNVAGLQGYERFYFMNLLGTYFTPFKLNVQMAYDYNSSAIQSVIVTPDNYAPAYGDEANWGSGGPWGGSEGNVFTARIFPEKQKCQSFQIVIDELYDSSYGVAAGQGLDLSGIALVVGVKKGYRTQSAAKSFG